MFYQIKEKLTACSPEDIKNREYPYVANISWEEFEKYKSYFDMGIDMDMAIESDLVTKIQVNYDSLTGCIAIPDRSTACEETHTFAFAIDEKGIVLINDDGTAQSMIQNIMYRKRWKMPCLERFIYDFLETIVKDDLRILEKLDDEMDDMEEKVLAGEQSEIMERLADIRSELRGLRSHYGQLVSLSQELEENENHFFETANLRFFRLFTERVERLQSVLAVLRDHAMQIRDLYHSKLEEKQNKKMAVLTGVTMIFTPLTLLTSWYGMNFKYMPILSEKWGYPAFIGLSIVIAVGCIIILKKKKWF